MNIMEKIQTILTATKRVAWDRIPDRVIKRYEDEMVILNELYSGSELKRQAAVIYNIIFGQYGYTKPVSPISTV